MRNLKKPNINVSDIINDCAQSYRPDTRNGIKNKLIKSIDTFVAESERYDHEATCGNWTAFESKLLIDNIISNHDMCDVYDSKFVSVQKIRNKYYDKIMSIADTGKCPICGIGQVSTLDHYLAKTLFPIFAVTPNNLVPVCKDCNFQKHDSPMDPTHAILHPYYDNIDSMVWLKSQLKISHGNIIVEYCVCEEIRKNNPDLFERLTQHMHTYGLAKAYSIQACTEISENIHFWKEKLSEWGEHEFQQYLREVLSSKETYQRNTWTTALYRELIENINIINACNI